MSHLRWTGVERPRLDRPVVIAAFEGWNDAGDAASLAARWLAERWAPEPLADIDPEEFFDFTTTRPRVRRSDEGERSIDWPSNTFTWGRGAGTDVVVLVGTEPQLRWRTFCQQVLELARAVDARLVLTLGALLAEVPHSRPTSVVGTAADPEIVARLALAPSTYEGPTGIVGVLGHACARAGLATASLWAAVPAYVPGAPSPKAGLALVEHTAELIGVAALTTDLEIAAAAYERQVSEVVADDEEMTGYLETLEQRFDREEGVPAASLAEEVERFLRNRPPDQQA
ncbi:MAG: PAC2 family protein [Actinomycetota bacterium]|jgi:proteasome assembly chaperone (PAC2) family protein|nr:PAC2 family protein [Actinomycetota bacterium]